MSAAPAPTRRATHVVYRAPVVASPRWPTVDPDCPFLADPSAPTLPRFEPLYRDVVARMTGLRGGG
ncbi:MAG: hypothetical protein ACRDQW_00255 [Haloechinothrix sp.]